MPEKTLSLAFYSSQQNPDYGLPNSLAPLALPTTCWPSWMFVCTVSLHELVFHVFEDTTAMSKILPNCLYLLPLPSCHASWY